MIDWTKIRAVFFDFDGTVADTGPYIFQILRQLTYQQLGRELTHQEHLSLFGKPLRTQMITLFGDHGESQTQAYCDQYRAMYNRDSHLVQPFPGLRETLSGLRSGGIIVGFVTAKIRSGLDRAMADFNLPNFYDLAVTGDEPIPPKPAPDMMVAALQRACNLLSVGNLPPHQAVMIGDSPYDAQSAQSANVPFALVDWTAFDITQFSKPDHRLASLPDLLRLLNLDGLVDF